MTTKMTEALSGYEAKPALLNAVRCPTTIGKYTICLTRGGDLVYHYERSMASDGKLAPSSRVYTRYSDFYAVRTAKRTCGRNAFKDGEYLDIVGTFLDSRGLPCLGDLSS